MTERMTERQQGGRAATPAATDHDRLWVFVDGTARSFDTPRSSFGRLGFVRADDGWFVIDEGLAGGMWVNGAPVPHLQVVTGTSARLRIGRPDGPAVVVEAVGPPPPAPEPPEPARKPPKLARESPQPVREPPRRDEVAPSVVARHVRVKGDAGQLLLDSVNLTFRPGTLTAVVGPSGAGKSTLLGALTGQLPLETGTVTWHGRDLHAERDSLGTVIGLVPQEDIQHPQLSVRRSLEYSARLRLPQGTTRREIDRRVDEVISQVGLEAQRHQRISSLSGGQSKRVSIATELITSPPLLLLDEPTSGLDPGRDRSVMQQLRELATGDRVVVAATHSVLGLDVCDQVIVMARGGRVAHVGPPDGLLDHFGCDDYPQLFDLLESQDGLTHDPAATPPHRERPSYRSGSATSGFATQLGTFLHRNVALMVADRLLLAMLLLMPVVLALLGRVVQGSDGLALDGSPKGGLLGTEPGQRLTILVVAAALMGTAMTIRDLVHERAIFRRERAVGLSAGAYYAAKAVCFGIACFGQGLLATRLSLIGLPEQTGGGVHDGGWWEIAIPIGLLAMVSAWLGLWASALVRTADQAAPALVAIVMAQVVLSSALVQLEGRPVLEQLSWLAPSRWAYGAMSASVDPAGTSPVAPEQVSSVVESLGADTWTADLAGLALLGIVVLWLGSRAVRARR